MAIRGRSCIFVAYLLYFNLANFENPFLEAQPASNSKSSLLLKCGLHLSHEEEGRRLSSLVCHTARFEDKVHHTPQDYDYCIKVCDAPVISRGCRCKPNGDWRGATTRCSDAEWAWMRKRSGDAVEAVCSSAGTVGEIQSLGLECVGLC